GQEEQSEQALGEERAEGAEAVEVAEHPREEEEACEPEEAHQPRHRHGAQPIAAHDVAEREEARLEQGGERHARPSPPACRMSRKTVSSDGDEPALDPARARSSSSVPTLTRRPAAAMPTRPHRASDASRLCVASED